MFKTEIIMTDLIEVFKTNVQEESQDKRIIGLLRKNAIKKVNFDLDDCDRILRVESRNIDCSKITKLLNLEGFECEVLD
jgi:hypothetical protein